jgi:hypothetical protein
LMQMSLMSIAITRRRGWSTLVATGKAVIGRTSIFFNNLSHLVIGHIIQPLGDRIAGAFGVMRLDHRC